MNYEFPDYIDVNNELRNLDLDISPAECQGLLCGLLGAANTITHKEWLNAIKEELDSKNQVQKKLIKNLSLVHIHTLQQLNNSEFSFELYLPEEDEDISLKTKALAAWCQGYLYGFGLKYSKNKIKNNRETNEIINDFNAISQANLDDEADNEENETSFSEIYEYVKISTLLIYENTQENNTSFS